MKLIRLRKHLTKGFLSVLLLASASAWAEIAVIVHPSNNSDLSKKQISRIYLGKSENFPDGSISKPIDQNEKSLIKASFSKKVLNRTQRQLSSYWAKLMFSGDANPPIKVNGDAQVKKLVSEKTQYIGYIDAENVDDTVKVILTF